MPDVPQVPSTATPATPDAAPIAPAAVPPAAPMTAPSAPAAMAPQPAMPPAQSPAAMPPKPPTSTPPTASGPIHPSTTGRKIFGALVALICLVILGVLGLIMWPKLSTLLKPKTPTTTVQTPVATSTSVTQTTPPPGSTTSTTTKPPGCVAIDGTPGHYFGDTVDILKDDPNYFCYAKDTAAYSKDIAYYKIWATEFGDSRCQPNVKCVWAGEQTVTLQAAADGTEMAPEKLILGTTRAKTGKLFGHAITLHEIDDGKGGTYAEITVE